MRLALTALIVLTATAAAAHGPRPVGDGKISKSPRQGFVFSCQQRFNPNAPGARKTGDWLRGGIFHPDEKVAVSGSVTWPNHRLDILVDGDTRTIRANNLPNHATGEFPVSRSDPAYEYDRNPNPIREQNILFRLPKDPVLAASPSCVPMGLVGFMLTGGAMYNALDARGEDAASHEILDRCGGHPQQTGQYHYHALSDCYPDGTDAKGHGELVGYALDGFGIFGASEAGNLVMTSDLDACHGHTGDVPWDGSTRRMYHYHLSPDYPYSVGCFMGKPVAAATGRQSGGQRPAGGRPDPVASVAAELGISADRLRRAVGAPPPNIDRAARELGIDRNRLRQLFRKHRP
ncbi:MAG: YHYH protein [Pseudomonadota bacterium]